MKEINFKFQPVPAIKVNGLVFEMRMSDADIFDRAQTLAKKYKTISKATTTAKILAGAKECAALVDEILGEGAMKKLTQGQPVRLTDALKLMNLIVDAAAASYTEKVAEYAQ